MRKQLLIAFCGLAGLILGTGCGKQSNQTEQKTFKPADIPSVYVEPRLRAEYLAMHYWDHFDFSDTSFVGSAANITEQAIVDFLSVFPYASYNASYNGIKHLLDKAQGNQAMYAFFTSKMEQILFHPNSQMRNEEFFIPVLEHMVESDSLDMYRKVRPKAMLEEAQKNRPGTLAANLHYTTEQGTSASLYDLKTDFVLLFFHNLDCTSCHEVLAMINASQVVKQMMEQKKLAILAIYPDMAEDMWKKHLSEMPKTWVHGYDKDLEIETEKNYILRVIPTLYLIDKEHRVIMKEAAFPYVELYLNNILNPLKQTQTGSQQ